MIVIKKIEFLRPLLLHASTLMRFSQEDKREQLSVSAQKAVWATTIIKTITKASLPTSLRDPTLRDLILNLPDPSKKFHFDEAEKYELMELFTEGIQLASPFQAQTRVQYAQQNGDPKCNMRTKRLWQKQKRFIFFPNRTVTTQMFKQLMIPFSHPYDDYFLTGGFGIGKTVSIILFIYLSSYQTFFINEASKDKEKQEEYDKLVKLELVPEKVVKYWYWSVCQGSDNQMKKLILAQAVELDPSVEAELMKQPQICKFINKLKTHFQTPDLFFRPIVDNVNKIAELMKRTNQDRETNIEGIKVQAQSLYRSFKNFKWLGYNYTLNSPVTIEKKILERGGIEQLGLDLVSSHKGLYTIHIPYEETVLTTAGQFDFWQTFWFEIERRMNLPSAQRESAKETFYKSIQSWNLSNMQTLKTSNLSVIYRFVYIKQFLSSNYSQLQKLIMSQDDSKIQEIIKDFHSFCLESQSQHKIQSFLEKGEAEFFILLKLYLKACILKKKEQYRSSSFLLTIPQLDQILKVDLSPYDSSYAKQNEYKEARNALRYLLAFQTKEAVKFIFNLQKFTMLAEKKLLQSKPKDANFLKSEIKRNQGSVSGVKKLDLELAAEQFLIDCLDKNVSLEFEAIKKPSHIKADKYLKIHQVALFDQLSNIRQPEKDKCAFEGHFRSAISMALRNSRKDILALPSIINDYRRIRSVSSNSIVDFVILTYDRYLHIDSFDVTTSLNLNQKILQVRNLFTKLLEGVTSIQGMPILLNHTFLCPKDASYQQQVINKDPLAIPMTIWSADISKLTVNTRNYSSLSAFKYVIKLNTSVKEEEEYGALLRKHDH